MAQCLRVHHCLSIGAECKSQSQCWTVWTCLVLQLQGIWFFFWPLWAPIDNTFTSIKKQINKTLKQTGNWSFPISSFHQLSKDCQLSLGAHAMQTCLLTGLTLCGSSAGSHSHCEFMSSVALSCPEDTTPALFPNCGFYNRSTPILWWFLNCGR